MKDDRVRLNIVEFGKQLLETKDLDPLYVALWGAKLPRLQLCRWLVAYWCYYHAGLCCWISEQEHFFDTLDKVAKGGTDYPRGTERRHFRGDLATNTILLMRRQFSGAAELIHWIGEAGPRADDIMGRVETLYGFGKWIAGKIPDMLERLGLVKVQFIDRDVDLMFSSPKKAATELANQRCMNNDPLLSAHKYLIEHLKQYTAPPRYERLINVQETETIFCKFGAHLTGHYPVGKDTEEIKHGLFKYATCRTSQKLLKAMRSLSYAQS